MSEEVLAFSQNNETAARNVGQVPKQQCDFEKLPTSKKDLEVIDVACGTGTARSIPSLGRAGYYSSRKTWPNNMQVILWANRDFAEHDVVQYLLLKTSLMAPDAAGCRERGTEWMD
ncbi:hypothetical protein SBOR_0468 [Sclerotinia borealis F-4128]|uniref:Uncharacterized protein n=1 Tax=Sclerotinia borealis (strain F-4128) TaxID=1432307 RepID=W9CQN3_SCLBF|nr:hypothetical protein SBOR_0468 [Sclerotinia borealis F-4128]